MPVVKGRPMGLITILPFDKTGATEYIDRFTERCPQTTRRNTAQSAMRSLRNECFLQAQHYREIKLKPAYRCWFFGRHYGRTPYTSSSVCVPM